MAIETKEKKLGIYVHIPFCRSKCEYCDFYSLVGGRNKDLMYDYQKALLQHFKEGGARAPEHVVDTVYFGGGTPSFYGADRLKTLLAGIEKRFTVSKDAEITFEANPDSVTLRDLKTLFRAGFNRISIGVQSDNDEQLKSLGRPHNFKQAKDAVEMAREAGFENVTIDLMYGLPNQTRRGWAMTLRNVLDLKPDHVSCYGLKVEKGTPLYEYQDCANLPDDDMQADMYLYAVETLNSFGYKQYEISNFAKEGYDSRHNMKYWMGDEYMGFGASASSDFGGKRYTYISMVREYIDAILQSGVVVSECEDLPLRERAGEYLMLRMRTSHGVEAEEYHKTFLAPFEPLEEALQAFQSGGFAEKNAGRWKLTPQGLLVSNQIIGELIEAQEAVIPKTRRYGF